MDNYEAIIADIKAKLTEIEGGGVVHDYERWIVDAKKFLDEFKDPTSGRVLGCEITRKSVSEHQRGAFFGHNLMVVQYYMGLSDAAATDKLFQVLINRIRAKFRQAEPTDVGAPWDYRNGDDPNAAPVQVPVIDLRMFGNVLCHHAEIHISVTERTL